jgi:hypothetical protein
LQTNPGSGCPYTPQEIRVPLGRGRRLQLETCRIQKDGVLCSVSYTRYRAQVSLAQSTIVLFHILTVKWIQENRFVKCTNPPDGTPLAL